MIQYKLSNISTKIGFCASFLVNTFFIYLTLFHIKNVTGTYKHLVVFFAITGTLFSGIEIFAKPFAHNYDNSMIYFSLSESDAPEWVTQLMLALWAGFYSLIVSALATQFIFRYLCLLGSDVVKDVSWVHNLMWILYPMIPAIVYGALLYALSMPDAYSDDYVKDALFNDYCLVLSKVPRFIMVTYASDGSVRWSNLAYLGSAGSIVFSHYAIIIYCGFQMHFEMKKGLKNFSVANRKLQKQFFKALIFQSLGPTIFIFLPAIPVLLVPLIPLGGEYRIDWQTGWLFSVIGAYPPFDSISFMIIVVEYKKVIKSRYFNIPSKAGDTVSDKNKSRKKINKLMYST